MTDLRTSGTAFVVGAEGVTLDLNGHEVIFGDHKPVAVTNGGFEEGSGVSARGWDLRGAPSAALVPNTSYLSGKQVLRLDKFTTPQRIVSDPIAIPKASHTFAATVTPAHSQGGSSLKISVLDASGRVVASGESRNVERAFSAIAHFRLAAPGSVRLVIEATPTSPKGDTVDLDDVAVFPSFDFGVIATRRWDGEIEGWSNLPAHATTNYRIASNFTITGGKLTKGGGGGYGSSPLYCADLPGLTVEHVTTLARGMDVSTIFADRASDSVTIRDSTFTEDVAAISDRMKDFATLVVTNVKGPITIEGNTLEGCPQIGIHLGFNDPSSPVRVLRNTIRQRAVATNAYGIVVVSLQNFEIAENKILAENGRGIDVDGYSAVPLQNGLIRENVVEVQERLNREYPDRLESRALRMRNNVDAMGPHRNLRLVGNTFIAKTGPGLCQRAFAARISYTNKNGSMNDSGIVIEKNTFKALVMTDDPSYKAEAFVIDTFGAGIHPRVADNVFESNDTSLAIGDSEQGDNQDFTLFDNILRRSKDGPSRPYTAILVGYFAERTTGVKVIGSRFENGASLNLRWRGSGTKDLAIGWPLEVTAKDTGGRPVAGATVRVTNGRNEDIASASTSAQGKATLPLVATLYRQAGEDPKAVSARKLGPFSVRASSGSASAKGQVASDRTRALELILK